MRLLYISTFMFSKQAGKTFALPSCSDSFFEKYLDVFDSVRVLGEEIKAYLDKSALVEMKDKRIEVRILPANTKPQDFKNDTILKKALTEEIKNAEAIIIKPASRRGIMAIKIAEKLKKPYMIEMTGDIHNALKQSPDILKRIYAPFLYYKTKNALKNVPYGLYVSRDYLQSQFPIKGKMCGCSDVVLEKADDSVLEKRYDKIDNLKNQKTVSLALVGFYQGKMKGIEYIIGIGKNLMGTVFFLYLLKQGTVIWFLKFTLQGICPCSCNRRHRFTSCKSGMLNCLRSHPQTIHSVIILFFCIFAQQTQSLSPKLLNLSHYVFTVENYGNHRRTDTPRLCRYCFTSQISSSL